MKRVLLIASLLMLTTASASAAWSDLKEGLDQKAAEQLVGAPLFGNRSRGSTYINWVYDNGGYILFEKGRVLYWQPPADKVGSGAQVLVSAAGSAPGANHPGKSGEAAAAVIHPGPREMALHW